MMIYTIGVTTVVRVSQRLSADLERRPDRDSARGIFRSQPVGGGPGSLRAVVNSDPIRGDVHRHAIGG